MNGRWMLMSAVLSMSGCFEAVGPRLPGEDPPDATPDRMPVEDDDAADDGADSGEPGQHGEGEAETPTGRRVRRMTADQFHATLTIATGQAWPRFDEFAEAMGKADLVNVTNEGRELSVTFDKFIHDAALYSCTEAVHADRAAQEPGAVLRWVDVGSRDHEEIRHNLDYLILRFLGQQTRQDDPRVDPWMNLLMRPSDEGDIDDDEMQERWTVVCVGLATHPDFVTY